MGPERRGAGDKRKARMVALQALYEVDTARSHRPEATAQRLLSESRISPVGAEYCGELVLGVSKNRESIDSLIKEKAPLWPLDQVSHIDLNILRIAVYEMVYNDKVPKKVVINEAVELAKLFGSSTSAKFVNGVLGAIYGAIEAAKAR